MQKAAVKSVIQVSSKTIQVFSKFKTPKKSGGAFVHQGIVTMGNLKVTQNVEATVKADIRASYCTQPLCNSPLLHAALRQILGTHVQQKGSLVASELLRFDFANDQPVHLNNFKKLNVLVNAEVIANTAVSTELLDIEYCESKRRDDVVW